jgi:nucleosome binding factor SPN SPT16 subunit
MGIEFRDAGYILSVKNTRLLRQNMIFNLSLGFTGLSDSAGQKFGISLPVTAASNNFFFLFFFFFLFCRYALNLVDTIKIEVGKASLLTDGTKSPQAAFFFLTNDSELEKPQKNGKKAPTVPTANGSPLKQKTIAGKVLRNQTRRAVQDEVHQTATARLIDHQRELHENLQAQGLAKFSENGVGYSGKEGKGWKKFQSYKGDGALPTEVDRLRVGLNFIESFSDAIGLCNSRFLLIAKRKRSFYQFMDLPFLSTSIL